MFEGDDGELHYVFETIYDTDNHISIYKHTDDKLYLSYKAAGAEVRTDGSDISAWNAGEWHQLAVAVSEHTVDLTDRIQLYIDSVEVNSELVSLGDIAGLGNGWSIGSAAGSDKIDALLSGMFVSHFPFRSTEALAIADGMLAHHSIQNLYNSGDGNTPVCDWLSGFMMAYSLAVVQSDYVVFEGISDVDIVGLIFKNAGGSSIYVWPNSAGSGLNIDTVQP
jgi:hypothetical protein